MFIKACLAAGIIIIVSSVVCLTLPATQIGTPRIGLSQQERDMQDRQIKEMNKKRQQDIKNDTEKLFQLATDLKAAVDKTNENMLSLEVVRKADEVEKLAKRVKEKMKEAIGPAPTPPIMPTPHFPDRG